MIPGPITTCQNPSSQAWDVSTLVSKKFKSQPSAVVILVTWWDAKGPVFCGSIISEGNTTGILESKVNPASLQKN